MAEYLSPGVYVEEYDSGAVPMQGVSTSTAGFIGMAQRGPVSGMPQFVTSFADYKRAFGGYLSEAKFGEARFLPYAVEQFFLNGGSRAYIMRVAAEGAEAAKGAAGVLRVEAANPGEWGNRIRVSIEPSYKAKTQVAAVNGAELTLKNAEGFQAGDVVELFDGRTSAYATILSALDNAITLDAPCALNVADTTIGTSTFIRTCELTLTVRFDEAEETYADVSLAPEAPNFVGARTLKSDLIRVSVEKAPKAAQPVRVKEEKKDEKKEEAPAPAPAAVKLVAPIDLAGGAAVLTLSGGSDGKVAAVNPAVYLGRDNGPGKRSGLAAFLENEDVSILAIPGVTMPEVQAALIAH